MVCKFQEISDFFNKYPQLLQSIQEQELKELLETFPHACKFVKTLDEDKVNCNNLEEVTQKTLELLDNAYDHEYTKDDILNLAIVICKVFDIVNAPKYHVPFILVMLSKL
jgi:allophanate hydrolase subunit 1